MSSYEKREHDLEHSKTETSIILALKDWSVVAMSDESVSPALRAVQENVGRVIIGKLEVIDQLQPL